MIRFERLGELTDLENSISNVQKAVQFTDDGHPNKAAYPSNLSISQGARFERLVERTEGSSVGRRRISKQDRISCYSW